MKTIIVCIAMVLSGTAFSQKAVSTTDFKAATGSWKGTLTYVDYTSGKPFTMPANMVLHVADREHVILSFDYPKEPTANGNDTIVISGSEINEAGVISREVMEDGGIKIVTEKDGVDGNDNRKAVLRHIYIISANSFQNTKQVKFSGTDAWIKRSEYLFSR